MLLFFIGCIFVALALIIETVVILKFNSTYEKKKTGYFGGMHFWVGSVF